MWEVKYDLRLVIVWLRRPRRNGFVRLTSTAEAQAAVAHFAGGPRREGSASGELDGLLVGFSRTPKTTPKTSSLCSEPPRSPHIGSRSLADKLWAGCWAVLIVRK